MPAQRNTGGSWKASSGSSAGGARGASRVKKVVNSRAAKDLKKGAKVAGAAGAAAYVLKKSNDATQKDMRKLEQLRRQYDKSAAKSSMTFSEYVRKYGNK